MSDTKVKLPDLTPLEYRILIDALRFYHAAEKEVALDASTDFKSKTEARANATLSANLLDRIG